MSFHFLVIFCATVPVGALQLQTAGRTDEQRATSIPVLARAGFGNAVGRVRFAQEETCERLCAQQLPKRPGNDDDGVNMIMSDVAGLSYFKIAKAASTAVLWFMINTYNDTYTTPDSLPGLLNISRQLPSNWKARGTRLAFTFTRDPLERAISAYGEVDHKRRIDPHWAEHATQSGTTYVDVPMEARNGADRFLAYLSDLVDDRLPSGWAPGHSFPESSWLCRHMHLKNLSAHDALNGATGVAFYDFVGKIENMANDWQTIQELAGVPEELRTDEIPPWYEAADRDADEDKQNTVEVARTADVKQRVSEVYAADYACFGYEAP